MDVCNRKLTEEGIKEAEIRLEIRRKGPLRACP